MCQARPWGRRARGGGRGGMGLADGVAGQDGRGARGGWAPGRAFVAGGEGGAGRGGEGSGTGGRSRPAGVAAPMSPGEACWGLPSSLARVKGRGAREGRGARGGAETWRVGVARRAERGCEVGGGTGSEVGTRLIASPAVMLGRPSGGRGRWRGSLRRQGQVEGRRGGRAGGGGCTALGGARAVKGGAGEEAGLGRRREVAGTGRWGAERAGGAEGQGGSEEGAAGGSRGRSADGKMQNEPA